MICMKNKTILAVLILFGVFILGFVSASACDYNVGINYAYGKSDNTGINIGYENGSQWIENTPVNLTYEKIYDVKLSIKNYEGIILSNLNIIFKIDNNILNNSYKSLTTSLNQYQKINLNTSKLNCGYHNISVEISKENCNDLNLSDNSASRQIYVNCQEVPSTNNTNQTEPERIIDVSHKNSFVQFCNSNWICSGWSECSNGIIIRECVDKNYCDMEYNKPYEKSSCDEKILSNAYIETENTNYIWIIIAGIILFIVLLIILFNMLK